MDKVRPILVLLTPNINPHSRKKLTGLGVVTKDVDPIPTPTEAGISHVAGWLGTGYTKLHVWNLTSFSKVVYIDCDCLVSDSIDELFERPGAPCPSAAPDIFPPDRFNAGVLVVEPSQGVFSDMISRIADISTYDGGDTGFLNAYFAGWFTASAAFHLPFGYNAQRTLHWMTYERQPGYWESIKPLKVLHYSRCARVELGSVVQLRGTFLCLAVDLSHGMMGDSERGR